MLMISLTKYAKDLLQRAGLKDCKAVPTPMSVSDKLMINVGDPLDTVTSTRYRSLVGGLQYLTLTRPDIAFVVNKVCEYLHSPTSAHYTVVKRILRYISGTLGFGLRIGKSNSSLVSAFSDADWAGCSDDQKSTGALLCFWVPVSYHGLLENK